jgi:hypothetical protein
MGVGRHLKTGIVSASVVLSLNLHATAQTKAAAQAPSVIGRYRIATNRQDKGVCWTP